MTADLRAFQLGRVSPSHRVGDLLQDQSHSLGILLQLLHEVRSAPTHLPEMSDSSVKGRGFLKFKNSKILRFKDVSLS